jgi:hypothetical protein
MSGENQFAGEFFLPVRIEINYFPQLTKIPTIVEPDRVFFNEI